MYLLNYARTGEQLRRFCQVCHDALRPGGRFVGFNDNVRNPSSGTVSWKKYGLEKSCASLPKEGDVILYTVTNADGQHFKFENFFLTPDTHRDAFRVAGFQDFQWVDVSLHPAQRSNPFWGDFMTTPPPSLPLRRLAHVPSEVRHIREREVLTALFHSLSSA